MAEYEKPIVWNLEYQLSPDLNLVFSMVELIRKITSSITICRKWKCIYYWVNNFYTKTEIELFNYLEKIARRTDQIKKLLQVFSI